MRLFIKSTLAVALSSLFLTACTATKHHDECDDFKLKQSAEEYKHRYQNGQCVSDWYKNDQDSPVVLFATNASTPVETGSTNNATGSTGTATGSTDTTAGGTENPTTGGTDGGGTIAIVTDDR